MAHIWRIAFVVSKKSFELPLALRSLQHDVSKVQRGFFRRRGLMPVTAFSFSLTKKRLRRRSSSRMS